jgi:hypothetical protein
MPKLMQIEIDLVRMRMKPARYLQLAFMNSPWPVDEERQAMTGKNIVALAILQAVMKWFPTLSERHQKNVWRRHGRRR